MEHKIVSLQIAKVSAYGDKKSQDFLDKYWESGSFKKVVNEKVWANTLCLEGDEVADKIHHGGVDKAIFANSYENYTRWQNFLELKNIPFGALSENLTLNGFHESNVFLGDIHQVGSVLLQVSQPRKPCWKISKRWKNKDFTKEIYTSGLTGWYYRVLQEGFIKTGDEVTLVSQEKIKISILEANNAFLKIDKNILKNILQIPSIALSYKTSLEKRIEGTYNLAYMDVE